MLVPNLIVVEGQSEFSRRAMDNLTNVKLCDFCSGIFLVQHAFNAKRRYVLDFLR